MSGRGRSSGPACEGCGCTEECACSEGCGWDRGFAKAGRAVCTRCADIVKRVTKKKGAGK